MTSNQKTATSESSTHLKPKVSIDEEDALTSDFNDKEENPWIYFTEWTCKACPVECDIQLRHGVLKQLCALRQTFDVNQGVKLTYVRNTKQNVILVFGHDTNDSALDLITKFVDVRGTVLAYMQQVDRRVGEIKVTVRYRGLIQLTEEEQGTSDKCLFESQPDDTLKYTSETTWFCKHESGIPVADKAMPNRHFTVLLEDIRRQFGALLRTVQRGSVKFTVHHENTKDALEMISKHKEVRAMMLACLQGIDSTVKDIQMEVQLQDFIATNTSTLNNNRREDTILHKACRAGTLSQVRQILSQGLVDINSRGMCGWTPVMIAAKSGRRKLVDLLVRKHCDLSLTDNDGNTILHVASVTGHVKIVRCVLSKKVVDVNSLGHCDRTPVMAAARFGHKKVFKLLMKNGSDLSIADSDSNNIIHIACIGGHVKMVKYILNKVKVDISIVGHNGMTPLMFAIQFGNIQVFELLMRSECLLQIVEANGRNILHVASERGNVDMVKHILRKSIVSGDKKDMTGKTPVMLAVEFGHTGVFKLLVNNNRHLQDVYEDGRNILHMSCAHGHVDIVKSILTWDNIDIDCLGYNETTPLMFAVKNGHTQIFNLLVSKGCDMSLVDKDGNTVLHMACIGGNEHVVEDILSNHSGDINSRGQSERTPVMVAAVGGHTGVFDLLVNRGADLSLVDVDGCDILHLACMGGQLQMVQHVQHTMDCMK